MKKTNELKMEVEKFNKIALDQVGKTFDLQWQTFTKEGVPGQFEIIGYKEYENQKFVYEEMYSEERDEPSSFIMGIYKIKFLNTKVYNNKIYTFECSMYFSDYSKENEQMISISNKKIEDGKYIKAYKFQLLEA